MNSLMLSPDWILTASVQREQLHLLGGKARALALLLEAGFPIPDFFVLSPGALAANLGPAGMSALQKTKDSHEAEQILNAMEISPDIQDALHTAVTELCRNGERVAVRSSALDEDGSDHSFAGQLESYLCVPPEQICDKVLAVWKSAFAPRVWAYRRERGLEPVPQPPAVLIQRMISADTAGVAFSADPLSGRHGIAVVGAVPGLGAALVSGEANADTFHVDRSGRVVERAVCRKNSAIRFDPQSKEGISAAPLSDSEAPEPALNDEAVQSVANLARKCERHFGVPQDIEWAITGGQPWLLQSRPITTLSRQADPDGILRIWDNSNIVESYGGITTPLTFSFIRRAYEEVYREFCRLMRVPRSRVIEADTVFQGMLGLICGRVYYNLGNWHRVLAMLPGYQINRHFMEQMMGVREPLPPEAQPPSRPIGFREKCRDLLQLARTVSGLIENHFTLPRLITRFQIRLEKALSASSPALETMRPDELAAHYRDLERQLLTRWDAPLVNDFFAMIFHGILRKLCEKWCESPDGALANELIRDEGGIISAEPARRLRELATLAASDPELVVLLQNGAQERIGVRLKLHPELGTGIDAYLDKFGDRCLGELKLESATLRDDRSLLYRSIGNLAAAGSKASPLHANEVANNSRKLAEKKVHSTLGGTGWRVRLFHWILRHTRERVRHRENLRFDRTRLFGRVRLIFTELGKRFHAMKLLPEPRDIFYLEINEVLGFIDGTTTTTNLAGLVEVRKAEFQRFHEQPSPPDRLNTRGMVAATPVDTLLGSKPVTSQNELRTESGEERKGIGCCPGVVRGRVRVVTDPNNAVLQPGEILVAEHTDPGWVMLFPAASGLLVERGSLLSHSAIVSRELGLPGIVSIPQLTSWLRTGDEILMDGTTGVLQRITSVQP